MAIRREPPEFPSELNVAIRGSIDTGRARETLVGSLRSYPNDGEYLFSVGLESGTRLARHGGHPALTVVLAALSAFPAVVERGAEVVSLSPALGGLRVEPDDSDHSDSDHSDQSDHSPDDSGDHSDQTDHSPDDSQDHTPSDHSPDHEDGGSLVVDLGNVFETWAASLLEVTVGEFDAQLTLDLVNGRTTATAQMRRTADAAFEADIAIESLHEVADVGDLVRLLPLDLVLVPVGAHGVSLRGEVHFLRADGEVVSGQLTGHLRHDGEQALAGPVLVSHTFSPGRLSQHPVSVQALGIARSLTVRQGDV